MKLAYKIIIGIVISIIAIFAIMLAVVLVVSINTMSQIDDEFIEKAMEIRELNDARIIENVNPDENRMLQPTTQVPSTIDCDKSYPDFCIIPYPPNLDCKEIPGSNFKVIGADLHGFDADNDGIGCEVGSPSISAPATSEPVPAAQEIKCTPSYPDVCIASYPPDLDCGEIGYSNFKVIGDDPHGFDGDNDGIGCES